MRRLRYKNWAQHFKTERRRSGSSDVDDVHFVSQIDAVEDLPGLAEQDGLVGVACAVVAEQELAYMGIAGHGGSLARRRVVVFLGTVGLVVGIGALVVEGVHAHHRLVQLGHVAGVGTVGVAAWRIRWGDQLLVLDDGAVGQRVVVAGLDVVDLRGRYAVHVDGFAADVRQRGLLAEEETGTGHAVVEGEGLDGERVVLKNDGRLCGVDGVELDAVADVVVEEQVELCLEHGPQGCGGMDVERGVAAEQSEGGDEADEAEAVVAVYVGYEDVA